MDRLRVDILNPGAGMSRLLHPLGSRQRPLMALASSTDGVETGSWQGDCVVAGLLGTAEQWAQFEIEWKECLAKVGATWSSMGGAEARRSAELGGMIDTCGLVGMGSYVAGEEYERLSPEMQRSLTGGRPAEPYVLSFRHCVLEAAAQAAILPPEERVCFVLDGQDRLSSQAAWLLEEIKSLEPAPVRERLGALGFEPKQHFAPLQAAEWLGCELLRLAGNNGDDAENCASVRLSSSLPPRLLFKSFDRQAFRLLQRDWEKGHIESSRSFSRL
jgi:hypothetical protein